MIEFSLSNDRSIPSIGLGTWKSTEEDAYQAVRHALEIGYRHIDTAAIYGNEAAVGRAIQDSGIPREELFVTTKLWNNDQGYESTKAAFARSLERLGLDYIDLYLIHWFKGYDKQVDSWRAMEELVEAGKIKSIGVSNHNVHHIQHLLEHARIRPVVNQIETHVELQNEFLIEFCREQGIRVEAYAPLMSWRVKELFDKDILKELATRHGKTIPQIVLRWLHQRGVVVLPKSVNPNRIEENMDWFDVVLSDEDMAAIATLNKGNKMFTEFDNVPY
jgi:diketogulonate reductase-like aldo/keto reductase